MKIHMNLQLFAQPANHTGATGMSAEMKTYYEKRLLDQAEPLLVHDQFGDKYPIPANNGKTIEFRKYESLPKATEPLTEGVTPNAQALTVTPMTATVKQYGGWAAITDVLQLTAIDNNITQATKVLASQDHGEREGRVSGRKRPGPGEAGEEAAGPRGRRGKAPVRGKELCAVGKRCGQEGREGEGREELVGGGEIR